MLGTLCFDPGGVDLAQFGQNQHVIQSTKFQTQSSNTMSTIPQRELYRMISEAAERGERVVVATVAHTRGSTPQQRGANRHTGSRAQ